MKAFFAKYWWFFLIPIPIIIGVVVVLENKRVEEKQRSTLNEVEETHTTALKDDKFGAVHNLDEKMEKFKGGDGTRN